MNPELRDVLTEALKAHKPTMKRISHPRRQGFLLNLDACIGCEWTEQDGGDHDSHVADVIASLPGVAVIQLPEPVGVNGADNRVWSHLPHYVEQEFNGDVIIDDRLEVDAADLRETATALLAAAVVAEGEDNHA
ncbi:hypothetical protein PBI_ALSFRO_67 [Mycobacterium phage Alsfro]|uniref:hypothetical protein n=1 Tax=Mycobacterium phage Alsfro TaxID=1458724 RepID=UPI00042E86C5|nr:hypothetical protein PBI_ALSFRO_67 [Mycobacterium phage Alsfro]AHK12118.1 hypothetical protein PBI_ALSFRO_67 [Mycobacterium phage Alsfro]